MVVVGIGVMAVVVAEDGGGMAAVSGVTAAEVAVAGPVTTVGKKGILQGIAPMKRSDNVDISLFSSIVVISYY